jgi:hypothetical protein
MTSRRFSLGLAAAGVACAALLAACGGGGYSAPAANPNPVSTATPPAVSTQQVVTEALPTTVMGVEVDPTFGMIGGFTQAVFSQTLAFAPGAQIMIHNGQANLQHTFGVDSTTGFDTTGAALSPNATGGATIAGGFNTGTLNPGATAGPFTLAAGIYWIGCDFHFLSNNMRTVLQVSAAATPGPQATAPPGLAVPTSPPGTGTPY